MNFMLVQYDPFSMESRVFVVKDQKIQETKVTSNLTSLAQDLVTNAYLYDIYNVKLNAPRTIFDTVKDNVTSIEQSSYSMNKIILENE